MVSELARIGDRAIVAVQWETDMEPRAVAFVET
jgi:hypothetical protein